MGCFYLDAFGPSFETVWVIILNYSYVAHREGWKEKAVFVAAIDTSFHRGDLTCLSADRFLALGFSSVGRVAKNSIAEMETRAFRPEEKSAIFAVIKDF
ncbi:MAG: hypothetical protein ACK40G_14575 [Cytophagaceae bacterium]